MSSTLYKEALLEVESLKKMAEENAKNKIIEAVTPQIRKLIESQLLGEKKVDELDDLLDSEDDSADSEELDMSAIEMAPAAPAPVAAPAPEPTPDAPKIKIDVQGDLNIEIEDEEAESLMGDDDLILGQQVGDVVESYILGKRSSGFRVRQLSEKTKKLAGLLESVNLSNLNDPRTKIALLYYAKLLDEAVSLATSGIIIEESVDLGLLSQLKTTIKEIRHMANRRDAVAFRRLLEELEAEADLKEIIGEEDEAEEGAEEAPAAEAEVPAEAVDAAEEVADSVDSLLAALGLDDEGEPADDDDDDDEEEVEAGEEVLELEADDKDEAYMNAAHHMEADDKDEAMHEEDDKDEAAGLDEVFEIDPRMLRAELRRMREGLEAEAGDPSADESEIGNPLDAQEDFGGSDEVLEVSEEDLVEALHYELNRAARNRPTRRRRMSEARRRARRATRGNGTTARIHEANQKLRTQLHEMNVFNAKLLFANKLMQNRDLTKKQQRAIVEALDSAKTVNEAKLLYKSLSKSISTRGNLSESKSRLLASSSRSTRSGSPASNGVDGDRWALLAGLTDKK